MCVCVCVLPVLYTDCTISPWVLLVRPQGLCRIVTIPNYGGPEGHHEWGHGIQVGMMCDATEEVMELLRYMDRNDPDLSLVCGECELFRRKIIAMCGGWGDGRQLMQVGGYTRMAGRQLQYHNYLLGKPEPPRGAMRVWGSCE